MRNSLQILCFNRFCFSLLKLKGKENSVQNNVKRVSNYI